MGTTQNAKPVMHATGGERLPVDGGMHLFSSRSARWRSFNVSSAQTNPHPTSPPSGSAATAKAQPTFSPKKRLYFIRRRGSDNTCARIPVLAMMHLGLKILSVNQRKETSPSPCRLFFLFLEIWGHLQGLPRPFQTFTPNNADGEEGHAYVYTLK